MFRYLWTVVYVNAHNLYYSIMFYYDHLLYELHLSYKKLLQGDSIYSIK